MTCMPRRLRSSAAGKRQRAYVWNQDNWEELLNTLSQESSSIFLGAVILQKREKDGSHVKSYAVIDGQQRLTRRKGMMPTEMIPSSETRGAALPLTMIILRKKSVQGTFIKVPQLFE